MALRPALDLELLRTLVFIAEEASFTKAAERVGRTQSAVTLQIQKLEGLVGQPLVTRSKGGPVELTPQGRTLVERARAMLQLNDETYQALTAPADAPVSLRFATSSTYVPNYLADALEAFRVAFPGALIEVMEGYSCQITPQVRDGVFDLVLTQGAHARPDWPATEIWRGPLRWVTSAAHPVHLERPLPLSLSPANCPWLPPWMDDCYWRSVALAALKRANVPHRLVAATVSLDSIYAPVLQGRAVTVSPGLRLPAGLRVVADDEGLPALPDDAVVLLKSRSAMQPHTDAFADIVRANFRFD